MRRGRAALAAVFTALGWAALAAPPPQLPAVLTPLGPVQTPLPSAPNAPSATPAPVAPDTIRIAPAPEPTPGTIKAEPLPVLTPPDPAYTTTPATAPDTAAPAATAPGAPAPPAGQPAGQTAPAAPPSAWVAEGTAVLVALDKVTARTTNLTAKVGETMNVGPLAVVARACYARPPAQPADSAAFLDIADGATRLFHGWMLAAEPSLGLLEHPVYDIRVIACRP
jgi:hypothetical protein